ncbi:hypothetical protein E2C01_042966 [Portunus trituberculatus]|uniref:Uncharacterized protein n=1 Tax=Portunus trituberculatus TaxID=210409 RepID=A0A5B7FNZ1_PORTR|nr:hypothetical protein [Portunus trituberculatus]
MERRSRIDHHLPEKEKKNTFLSSRGVEALRVRVSVTGRARVSYYGSDQSCFVRFECLWSN